MAEAAPTFVSLNPCLDAILVEVAEADQILALSHYSRDPASSSMPIEQARQYAFTGGTAEEVIALNPDIVLASTFIAPTTKASFERLDIRVETFGSPGTLAASQSQIRKLAELTGRTEQGEALVRAIDAAPHRPQGETLSAVMWQPGQIVPGEATLIAEHLSWAGFSSHSADMGLGQADFVSLERLLADPPDILLIAGDRPGQRHPLLSELRNTKVAAFDPRLLFCGGPSIPRARERLAEIRSEFERDLWRGDRR